MALIWHEAVGGGVAESLMVQTDADNAWQTLVIPRDQVIHTVPGDNFAVGLIGPEKGRLVRGSRAELLHRNASLRHEDAGILD